MLLLDNSMCFSGMMMIVLLKEELIREYVMIFKGRGSHSEEI